MSSFRNLTADREPLERFKAKAEEIQDPNVDYGNQLPIHLFEWTYGSQTGTEIDRVRSVNGLKELDIPAVRVLFAPRDIPIPDTVDGLIELFQESRIPTAFVAESLQGVSQSFAAQTDENGTEYIWFHFLSKNLDVSDDNGPLRIVHQQRNPYQHYRSDYPRGREESQANFTWLKPGFVLRIENSNGQMQLLSRATDSSNASSMTMTPRATQVTLFCFGAPGTFRDRFQNLKQSTRCEDLLYDPYGLLEVVLEEMYKKLDEAGWLVSDIFGGIERKTLRMASEESVVKQLVKELDITGLHNLAKHAIYLQENCESALATLESLQAHHEEAIGKSPNYYQASTQQALKYRKTLFQSTRRRLSSLDKRMTNILELSFNLRMSLDSKTMMWEGQSMRTIAVMTLIFMPLSTVATVFGTQMIKLDDDDPFRVRVSQDFWLIWLISVPLTVFIMVYWFWKWGSRKPRKSKMAQWKEEWKSLKESLRGVGGGSKKLEHMA